MSVAASSRGLPILNHHPQKASDVGVGLLPWQQDVEAPKFNVYDQLLFCVVEYGYI